MKINFAKNYKFRAAILLAVGMVAVSACGSAPNLAGAPQPPAASDPDNSQNPPSPVDSTLINEELRQEIELADLTSLHSAASLIESRPPAVAVLVDAGKKKWQQIQVDVQYLTLRDALKNSGASDADIVAALQAAAYYGSGQKQDSSYQAWADFKNGLILDAREFMQSVEKYEHDHGVAVDRAYLEEKTRLPSIAGWKLEGLN